jgi:hypothetical protein
MGVYADYTKSCREVYTLATMVMLQEGHLSLLSNIQYPKARSDLPSWVPDWSKSMTESLQLPNDDHLSMQPELYTSGNPAS